MLASTLLEVLDMVVVIVESSRGGLGGFGGFNGGVDCGGMVLPWWWGSSGSNSNRSVAPKQ